MTVPKLANAELAVMNRLWEKGIATARQLREQLYPEAARPMHGTIQRLLQRLEAKGFVERDSDRAAHLFSPRISREAYAAGRLESLADQVTGGSFVPMITHLVEERKLSDADMEHLRRLLEER
ncbi:MAG: BlaI/MecI/CopY family transcriptional regulator [Gemmatimonadota bacterium]|nr:BlaI/MecI/CopY family transcriptional regulator [Gemmatimonadota bacterium]MDE2863485.1 BlaI/MecI/CopY family transcriptional regulator [Gemmatimonadota bacterium]MYB04794.1 BlaI/MecI/CopY family transcriptional regulator [Gemmatimonadota bacterium]MYG23674.1 BlaI/MecI/CopY family transcriptional regulator [Gemmatimonadota bacterium]MYJ39491.1 BlaI/MecI/CopY family transcriptional regulator [Gemmatimonadota bacterium]